MHTKVGGLLFSCKALGHKALCVEIDCPGSNTGCSEIPNAPKVNGLLIPDLSISKALRLLHPGNHTAFGSLYFRGCPSS